MAVNESRSLTGDLFKGATDGLVKKSAPDRGGEVEGHPLVRNMQLHEPLYDPAYSVDGAQSADRSLSLY